MSVLVKGMEKPEHCGYCRFRYDGICHAIQKTQYNMDECPLVGIDDVLDTNVGDTISRQAAIDVADYTDYTGLAIEDVKKVTYEVVKELKKLPPVDAVPVVRCKDCKWWDEKEDSPYGYCMAMKHGYFSSNWEIGIYRTYKGDWFCADGERKEE